MRRRPMVRRQPLYPPYREWRAVEDARGLWIVIDSETGLEPMRDADPYKRMLACHMAAAVPALESFARAVLPRLESTGWADRDRRYRHLCDMGREAMFYARPMPGTLARLVLVPGVLELPLDADGGPEKAA